MSELLSDYSFSMDEVDGSGSDSNHDVNDTYLEESWTDVITVSEGMSSKDKIQQETIWELLITERNYLSKIRVIVVVCIPQNMIILSIGDLQMLDKISFGPANWLL